MDISDEYVNNMYTKKWMNGTCNDIHADLSGKNHHSPGYDVKLIRCDLIMKLNSSGAKKEMLLRVWFEVRIKILIIQS